MQTIFDEGFFESNNSQTTIDNGPKTQLSDVKGLASKLHDISRANVKNDEPDWQGMLLKATTQHEKWQIHNAREAYELNRKVQAWEAQKAEHDNEVNKILAMPIHHRNKEFYDNLQKTKGRFYFDERISKQRKIDRQVMGLSYHLKRNG